MEKEETFQYLRMLSKGLKWAIKSGLVVGAFAKYGVQADHVLDLMLGSAAAIGVLTAAINYAKHRLGWKWIP